MTRKFTEKELKEIFDKYEHSWSYQQIAEHFGIDRKTVARLIGKTLPHNDTAGENNGHHVLTCKDVEEMREIYYATDISYRDIADQYGVSKSAALRAIKGESWKCVS